LYTIFHHLAVGSAGVAAADNKVTLELAGNWANPTDS